MSPLAENQKLKASMPSTNELGVFSPLLGAKYFSFIKHQSKSYNLIMLDEIIRTFLDNESIGLSFDCDYDKWCWRCVRTLHFSQVEFEISLFRDATPGQEDHYFIKFTRLGGCSKVFASTTDMFSSYIMGRGLDECVKHVNPELMTESPIYAANPNPDVENRGVKSTMKSTMSRCNKSNNLAQYNSEPTPTTAKQFVKSLSSLIQWSHNDVEEVQYSTVQYNTCLHK